MAGIGLRLREVVREGSLTSGALAYLSSAFISAGPWMTAVVALGALQLSVAPWIPEEQGTLLFATITYVFALSLVLTGPLQMLLTRHLADLLYGDDWEQIAPVFAGAVVATAGVLVPVAIAFVALAPLPLGFSIGTATLFVTVGVTWVAMVFLSAARDYGRIMGFFVLGYATSVVCGALLSVPAGVTGALYGFAFGQALLLGLIAGGITKEFPVSPGVTLLPLDVVRRYADLGLLGLVYGLALWADKAIHWMVSGTSVAGVFRVLPPYDIAVLVGYLLTIPALAVFMVQVETQFYEPYRSFYRAVEGRRGLAEINSFQHAMERAATGGFMVLVKVQTFTLLFGLLAAPWIAEIAALGGDHVGTLRIAIVAAGLQVFVLCAILLLLYLDARRTALVAGGVFAVTNVVFTLIGLYVWPDSMGVGFLASAAVSAVAAGYVAGRRLRRLTFVTFMSQPT